MLVLITIGVPSAFAVDNCAFYGHGSVVSVVGTGICSSIDAVSQCADGSYYYTGTANGVTDSYEAAMTALGCGSSNASNTQSSAVGRITSSPSSQTSQANSSRTSAIVNGLNSSLNLAAPALTQTQSEQNTTNNVSPEKPLQQTTTVPASQAGQHISDDYPQTIAQPVKPTSIKSALVIEPLIPAELLQPLKATTIPPLANQKAVEIANSELNTMTNYPILLMAIALSCLCLVAIVYFGIKRFSPEKN